MVYADVVRDYTGARRGLKALPTDDEQLAQHADLRGAPDHSLEVATKVTLLDDLARLTEEERAAVQLVLRFGYTYSEAAEILFHDRTKNKKVDHLLQNARTKLREWEDERQC